MLRARRTVTDCVRGAMGYLNLRRGEGVMFSCGFLQATPEPSLGGDNCRPWWVGLEIDHHASSKLLFPVVSCERNVTNDAGCSSWLNGRQISSHAFDPHTPSWANAALDEPVQKWQTLDGSPPLVIARGGFSGLFPESSPAAYQFAMSTGLPDVVLYCDLQLSSDGIGICKSGLKLDKSTLIKEVFPKRDKTYKLGTEDVHGWFLLDFTADELLNNVTVTQTILSRPSTFDGVMGMYTLDDVKELQPSRIWVNVEYACLAHTKENPLLPTAKPFVLSENGERPLIITHNGASGVFSGCTDLSYQQAVKDGADIIDCSVRMSKDGVAFCLGSSDLTTSTTAANTFMTKVITVSEIQNKSGIFSFDLSWSEIQTLKPDLNGPYAQVGLKRNPAAKNAGKLLTLPGFLDFAKTSNVSGILIEIEDAPYLATRGLGVVDAVSTALVNASYDKESNQQRVLIQSDDSSVLSVFKKFPKFERVLVIDPIISSASKPSVDEIKEFAHTVMVSRGSLVRVHGFFLSGFTDLVERVHDANLTLHVGVLRNEFMNIGFDYFADPMVEIATYSMALVSDGLVTEFPATAAAYFKSPCSDLTKNLSYSIVAANPGGLEKMVPAGALPPALPPAPVLEPADVIDPPLPPVSVSSPPEPTPKVDDEASSASSNAGNCLLVAGIAAFLYLSSH